MAPVVRPPASLLVSAEVWLSLQPENRSTSPLDGSGPGSSFFFFLPYPVAFKPAASAPPGFPFKSAFATPNNPEARLGGFPPEDSWPVPVPKMSC